MNYSKPITILAKKCFLSPVQHELEALISLNLSIGWFEEGYKNITLIETVFRVIQDKTLFDKFWNSFCRDTGSDAWSFLPGTERSYATLALFSDRVDVFKSFNQAKPGTLQDWKRFSEDPAVLFWALRPSFTSDLGKFNFPATVTKTLQVHRENYLWLTSQSEKELRGYNVSWDAQKEKKWLMQSFKNILSLNRQERRKNFWRLGLLLEGPCHWEKWSEKDWVDIWSAQPAGLLLDEFSEVKYGSRFENKFNAFVKKYQPKNDIDSLARITEKEMSYAVTHAVTTAGIQKTAPPWVSILLNNQEQMHNCVYLKVFLDFMAAPTKLPEDTASFLSASQAPLSVLDMDQKLRRSFGIVAHAQVPPSFEAYCLAATIQAHHQNLSPDFLNDIANVQKKSDNTDFFTNLVGYAARLATKSKIPKEQQLAAEVFWRAVFEIPPANQHYWLKKASTTPCLSGPLSFWTEEFSERLNKAAEKRKRTKEISSLLSRLSMNNAIAQVLGPDEKNNPKARRKM